MIKFLKNIIPNILFIIGYSLEFVGKIFGGIAVIFYNMSMTLHTLFNTETGKKVKEMEKATAELVNTYNKLLKKAQEQKSSEDNRLVRVFKDNKNITQLGNKKDDDSKS